MKILSRDIGAVICTKSPDFTTEVVDSNNSNIKLSVGTSEVELRKNIQVITSINLIFSDKTGKKNFGEFVMYVALKVELSEEEVSDKNNISEIKYFAISQSWPIFESQSKLLRELKFYVENFPPEPSKEEIISMLGTQEKK